MINERHNVPGAGTPSGTLSYSPATDLRNLGPAMLYITVDRLAGHFEEDRTTPKPQLVELLREVGGTPEQFVDAITIFCRAVGDTLNGEPADWDEDPRSNAEIRRLTLGEFSAKLKSLGFDALPFGIRNFLLAELGRSYLAETIFACREGSVINDIPDYRGRIKMLLSVADRLSSLPAIAPPIAGPTPS